MNKNEMEEIEFSEEGRDWGPWKRVILVGALGVLAIIFWVMMVAGVLYICGYR